MIYIQVRTARPRAPLGRERWQKEVALLKRKIKEKSQALGIFLLKSLCRKEVDKVATTGNLPDITHASDTASLQKSLHQTLERF